MESNEEYIEEIVDGALDVIGEGADKDEALEAAFYALSAIKFRLAKSRLDGGRIWTAEYLKEKFSLN